MTARYAVFGNPIAHSRSPQIHQMFAAQEGTSIDYQRISADHSADAFQAAVHIFFQNGGQGANVTLPFKEYACQQAQERSDRALAAGAANTLLRLEDGRLLADNTDGTGLVCDLRGQLAFEPRGKRILLLGAGGAARGTVPSLLDCQPAELLVCNRSHDKALALAQRFGIGAVRVTELPHRQGGFDLVLNATSGSLRGELPAVPANVFRQCVLAYDMVYDKHATVFMRYAAEHGAAYAADGLGMLVCQAAESYRLWRGFEADAAAVIEALRREERS